MRHRIRSVTPDIDRERLTLYGGLFLVVMFGYGLLPTTVMEYWTTGGLGIDPVTWAFVSVTIGAFPAALSVLFLKIHRYAYPPDG